MNTFHRRGPGGDALGHPVQSAWRYKWLLAVAVLVGALLGYGWAARQPTVYEGVSRVRTAYRCPDLCVFPREWAQELLSSSVVVQRAVELSGSRISAETLRQRLEVGAAQESDEADYTDVIAVRIGVVDSTAKGAAQLANAVSLAFQQVLAEQEEASARRALAALARRQRQLQDQIDALDHQLAAEPGNRRLQANRDAMARGLNDFEQMKGVVGDGHNSVRVLLQQQAARPGELVHPKPERVAAIGGLLGLVMGAGLAWWRSRPSRTLTMAAAGGP
jgi:uncharacterized protein involved in exopolysaccharide biosynthesis